MDKTKLSYKLARINAALIVLCKHLGMGPGDTIHDQPIQDLRDLSEHLGLNPADIKTADEVLLEGIDDIDEEEEEEVEVA